MRKKFSIHMSMWKNNPCKLFKKKMKLTDGDNLLLILRQLPKYHLFPLPVVGGVC